jgi:hypothetical protein
VNSNTGGRCYRLVSAAFVVVLAGLNKTKVNWKPSKALGSVGGWTVDSRQRGGKLSSWTEFVFGGLHCDGILVRLGVLRLDGNFEVNFGRAVSKAYSLGTS